MKKIAVLVLGCFVFSQPSVAGINIESLTLHVKNKKCEVFASETRKLLKLYVEVVGKNSKAEGLIEKQIVMQQKYLRKCLKSKIPDLDVGAGFNFGD